MIDKHHIAHYGLAIVFLAAIIGVHHEKSPTSRILATGEQVGAHDWPPLTQDQTITLGEVLNKLNPKEDKKVTLLCSSPACARIRGSIHEAFAIGWWGDDYEDVFIESEHDKGIAVGPPGAEAEAIAIAIREVTGHEVTIVPISDIEGSVGVIFGKFDGAQ